LLFPQGEEGQPGFYEAHHGIIHSFLHARHFSLELARLLHAPIKEIDPAQCAELAPPAATEEAEEGGEKEEGQVDEDHGEDEEMATESALKDTDDKLDLSED